MINSVHKEAMDLLTPLQHKHMALQVKELAMQGDPTRSETVSLDRIEDFYEIRDKGGPLGGLNVRLFFGVDDERRTLVILGVITKQNSGPTPAGDKVRMRNRWRKYKNGEFGHLA